MNHSPRIVVISESPAQRLAFGETIKSLGYDLVDCVPSSRLANINQSEQIDLWLVDSDDDIKVINQLSTQDRVLLGFMPSPKITDSKAFGKWQRHLKRKLVQLFGDPGAKTCLNEPTKIKIVKPSWKCIFVIGASMGGPVAVKKFLDSLSADLPVAIVMAQHSDSKALENLASILTLHNQWQCEVLTAKSQLVSGKVWLLPPDQAYQFHASGWLLPTNEEWKSPYKPSITETMISASHVFSKKVIHIVFSGMGDDGVAAVAEVEQMDSEIWVQSPNTCEWGRPARGKIETANVAFIGSPQALAERAHAYLSSIKRA